MTRDEAIRLVRERDGIKPPLEYIRHFCEKTGLTQEQFWETAEKFRNTDVWKKTKDGKWYIDGWIGGDEVADEFPHEAL